MLELLAQATQPDLDLVEQATREVADAVTTAAVQDPSAFWSAVIGGLVVVLGALGAVWLKDGLDGWRELRRRRADLIARVLGIEEEFVQACLMVVHAEALVMNHQARAWDGETGPVRDWVLEGAKDWWSRQSRTIRDALDVRRRLIEAIGQVRVLFNLDAEAARLVAQVVTECWTREPEAGEGLEELREWANPDVGDGVQIVAGTDVDARWGDALRRLVGNLSRQLPRRRRPIIPPPEPTIGDLPEISAREAIAAAEESRKEAAAGDADPAGAEDD